MEKTLIIHPKDYTTDFLKIIYSDIENKTVIDYDISSSSLKKHLKEHDKIIMLGHGSQFGLIGYNKFIIDSKLVYLLKNKKCVFIWCNADQFVKKYKLSGFYTGMIISEYEEAIQYSFYEPQISDINQSNLLFSQIIKENIHLDFLNMKEKVVESYQSEKNPIIIFNSNNIFAQ